MTEVRPRRPTRQPQSLSALLLVPAIFSTILCSLPTAQAYIPAQPLNDTSRLNLTDASTIGITWVLPAGVFTGAVSYQLQADVPTGGTTSGALVHFTENTMGPNQSTTTPWIAYISCDLNETNASQEDDIFTLARDRGAVSASCLLNTEYITDFEKPLDVFAAETLPVARVINGQFVNTNETFYYYNGTLLNESSNAVNLSLAGTPLQQRTFLIGTLTARNSTGQIQPTGIPGGNNDRPSDNDDNGKSGQPPAMIALYVVTGCISAMFALMIGMAARRAIRHPERYGRREGNENEAAQTRAGGIAQALLDTFPIVKFNRRDAVSKELDSETEMEIRQLPHSHADQERGIGTRRLLSDGSHGGGEGGTRRDSDPFRSPRDRARTLSASGVIPMEPGALSYQSALDRHDKGGDSDQDQDQDDISIKSVERPSSSRPRAVSASGSRLDPNVGPTSIPVPVPAPVPVPGSDIPGDMEEQCPICLLDFEDGEDLRVLPCEKEHVYHQTCIDPWLLDVSSSCPLCRKDFNSVPEPPSAVTATSSSSSHQAPTQSGFAKYLAFMRREKRTARNDSGRTPNPNRNRSRAGTGISHSSGSGSGSGSGHTRNET